MLPREENEFRFVGINPHSTFGGPSGETKESILEDFLERVWVFS